MRITTQSVDTWKKRIQIQGLKGSTYLCQQGGKVWVAASADHQPLCQKVLGEPNAVHSLESYLRWNDVSADRIVELVYRLANSEKI